ncbi:MAG: HEAT repeat domain-containing protein [Candidatus Omnitrophota bacterium]
MNQRNPTMKLIASTVVFTFFVTSLGITPNTFAATGVPTLTPQGFGGQAEVSSLTAGMLAIPAELGQVTDTVMGDPKAPAFIHIQSAHGNYQAEKNIEKLLGYIEKNSSVKLMLLEGAANKLQPELFRLFPKHSDFNRKVTDKLMQEGYLTGPERFLVENAGHGTRATKKPDRGPMARGSWSGFGVEDLDAYKKDRDAFISVVKSDKTAQAFLLKLRAGIDRRFASKLNKNLLNLVRQEEAFGSGTVSFESWIKVLGEGSRKYLKQDLSDAFYQDQYPFLIRYFRLQAIGSKIDREKARWEADAFLNELANHKVPKEILGNFKAILQLPETDLLKTVSRTTDGYSTLRRAFDVAFNSLPKDFSMAQWPNWTLYAQHIILMQEMEGKGLHEETLKLKDKIQTALAKTADEKEYLAKARELYLLRRLFNLELTRPEYEELTQTVKLSDIQGIQALYKNATDFYSTAIEREKKMLANALKRMSLQKQDRAVIVTGGFHADGLKKLAASKNCSYLQITPRIAEVSKRDHEVYLRSILGSRDVEISQMSAVLGLDPSAMRSVLGTQLKNWARNVRELVLGMIHSEPVADRSALLAALPQSFLSPATARADVRHQSTDNKLQSAVSNLQSETGRSEMRGNIVSKLVLVAAIGLVAASGVFAQSAQTPTSTGSAAVAQAPVAKTLSSKKEAEFQKALKEFQSYDSKSREWYRASITLRLFKDARAVPVLIKILTTWDYYDDFRSSAADILGEIKDPRAVPALIDALKHDYVWGIWAPCQSAHALGKIGDQRAISALIEALTSRIDLVRSASAEALGEIGDARVVPALLKVLRNRDEYGWVRDDVAKALGRIGDPRAVPALLEALAEVRGLGESVIAWENRQMNNEIIRAALSNIKNSPTSKSKGRSEMRSGFTKTLMTGAVLGMLALAPAVATANPQTGTSSSQASYEQKAEIARLIKDLFFVKEIWFAGSGEARFQASVKRLAEIGVPAIDQLIKALSDQEEPSGQPRRRFTARALGEIGDARAVDPLIKVLKYDENWLVRTDAAEALGKIGDAQAIPVLRSALKDSDSYVRKHAAVALGMIDAKNVKSLIKVLREGNEIIHADALRENFDVAPLIKSLADSNSDVRRSAAAEALGKVGEIRAVESLITALKDRVPSVRNAAAAALGLIKDPRSIIPLSDALSDKEPSVRKSAMEALISIRGPQTVKVLIAITMNDKNSDVRLAAVEALGAVKDPLAVPVLVMNAWNDEDVAVQLAARNAIEGDSSAVATLKEILRDNDSNSNLRKTAAQVLRELNEIGRFQYFMVRYSVLAMFVGGFLGVGIFFLLTKLIKSLRGKKIQEPPAQNEEGNIRKQTPQDAPRSEARSTENEFQKAMSDLQPKWWDGRFNGNGVDRRVAAARTLGELKDTRAVSGLGMALQDALSTVRLAVVDALKIIEGSLAIAVLSDALTKQTDGQVQLAIAETLLQLGDENVGDWLITVLSDRAAYWRQNAARLLGAYRKSKAVTALSGVLNDENPSVRAAAITALQELKALPELGKELNNKYPDVRASAATALGELTDSSVVPALMEALKDKDRSVGDSAATALEKFGDPRAVSVLKEYREMRAREDRERAEREKAERLAREQAEASSSDDEPIDHQEARSTSHFPGMHSFIPLPLLALAGGENGMTDLGIKLPTSLKEFVAWCVIVFVFARLFYGTIFLLKLSKELGALSLTEDDRLVDIPERVEAKGSITKRRGFMQAFVDQHAHRLLKKGVLPMDSDIYKSHSQTASNVMTGFLVAVSMIVYAYFHPHATLDASLLGYVAIMFVSFRILTRFLVNRLLGSKNVGTMEGIFYPYQWSNKANLPFVRSEVRLTLAQEKQFQKAMSDLQPKWRDYVFAKNAERRKTVAINDLRKIGAPAFIGLLGDNTQMRTQAAGALLMIRDKQLSQMERYLEWISYYRGTYNVLDARSIEIIQTNFAQGKEIQAVYVETPEHDDGYWDDGTSEGWPKGGGPFPAGPERWVPYIAKANLNITIESASRSEVREGQTIDHSQQTTAKAVTRVSNLPPAVSGLQIVDTSSLTAKIGTAILVAANTVSPLLSSSPVYASEVEPILFAGTSHFQKAPVIPATFAVKWPALSRIISHFATASTERMVIDQRQGVPDAASVLPLVAFARYNPKTTVALALIAEVSEVAAFEKELSALSRKGALPQNFAVRAFANENKFVGAFAGFYNGAAPLGQSVALITDREDSVVTQKIGSRRHLLSVVGAQNPLKQTASTLLAADKLLNESIWSMGYHFVSVEKLGGLEALMAELTSYVAAQSKVMASA